MQKNFVKKICFLLASWRSMTKRGGSGSEAGSESGSGSVSQGHGSGSGSTLKCHGSASLALTYSWCPYLYTIYLKNTFIIYPLLGPIANEYIGEYDWLYSVHWPWPGVGDELITAAQQALVQLSYTCNSLLIRLGWAGEFACKISRSRPGRGIAKSKQKTPESYTNV